MRSLEKIKEEYLFYPKINLPTKEEIDYYSLNEAIYKEWITEELYKTKELLFFELDRFDSYVNLNIGLVKKIRKISDIYRRFDNCMEYYPANQNYYEETPLILKKVFNSNLLDFLTYDNQEGQYSFASLVYKIKPEDLGMPLPWEDGLKYKGILIMIYYNSPKIFEELLVFFKDVIYQKYGLYLQEAMNVLIDFCKYNNLPYVNELKESHSKAMKLDYPAHNKFKYQLKPRKIINWKEIR